MSQRNLLGAVIVAALCAVGGLLALVQVAAASQNPVPLPVIEGGCFVPSPGDPDWQTTWLLVNTETFTIHLPIIANVQCRVGHTIDDAVNDVPFAHVDIVQSKGWLDYGFLNVEFQLRDVPPTLPFNRPQMPKADDTCWIEYAWAALVDADNNKSTGSSGYDIWISAMNCPFAGDPYKVVPIDQGVETVILRWAPSCRGGRGCWRQDSIGDIYVDSTNDIITLEGYVSGVASNAPISFWTLDYNPGGNYVQDFSCF